VTDEKKNGHLVGLSQKPKSWDDFMVEREQPKDQEREADDDFMEERSVLLDDGRGTLRNGQQYFTKVRR